MREAGLAKSNTLVRDAILKPELAMALLKRAPIKPGARVGRGSHEDAGADVRRRDGGAREQQPTATRAGVREGTRHRQPHGDRSAKKTRL